MKFIDLVGNHDSLVCNEILSMKIWCDDHEHSIRLKKIGDIVCLSNYTMVHDTENKSGVITWKEYYGRRNAIDMFKKHLFINFFFVLLVEIAKLILSPLKGYNKRIIKMRYRALYDGIMGNLGMDKEYKPGWKI